MKQKLQIEIADGYKERADSGNSDPLFLVTLGDTQLVIADKEFIEFQRQYLNSYCFYIQYSGTVRNGKSLVNKSNELIKSIDAEIAA